MSASAGDGKPTATTVSTNSGACSNNLLGRSPPSLRPFPPSEGALLPIRHPERLLGPTHRRPSAVQRRPAEHLAVAQDRDGTVIADGDDGGRRIVVAVPAARRVPRPAERRDGLFGGGTWHDAHTE